LKKLFEDSVQIRSDSVRKILRAAQFLAKIRLKTLGDF